MADEQTTRPTLDTILERIQQVANYVTTLRSEVTAGMDHISRRIDDLSRRVDEGFRRVDAKFNVLNDHVLEIHAEQRLLDGRVTALETKPS
jgi:hypothetical protein